MAGEAEQYVIWTRYKRSTGLVVRHVYGTWPTRARAKTVLKHMLEDHERYYGTDDLKRVEAHVVRMGVIGE